MKKIYLIFLSALYVLGCKNDKADLSGTATIKADDFLKVFVPMNFPAVVADTALYNFGDSLIISKTVFTQFIPDTAFAKLSLGSNVIIHPAGIIHNKEKDFILATFSLAKQTALGVFVLDDKHKFIASLPLLNNSKKDNYVHSVSITEEPTFIIKKEKFINNKNFYSRNGFAYSAATNVFAEVLHDSNEDTLKNNEVINPIDTFPSTYKFSGDYSTDKKNFIAVRDGKNETTYAFFIHFDKGNGACIGELKGTMNVTGDKTAVFTESGDPCVINFKFTATSINIKEQGNCGNHRGITCPFNFTFKKKHLLKKNN